MTYRFETTLSSQFPPTTFVNQINSIRLYLIKDKAASGNLYYPPFSLPERLPLPHFRSFHPNGITKREFNRSNSTIQKHRFNTFNWQEDALPFPLSQTGSKATVWWRYLAKNFKTTHYEPAEWKWPVDRYIRWRCCRIGRNWNGKNIEQIKRK